MNIMRFIMSFAFASLLLMGLVYLFYPHSTMPQLHKLSSGRLAILLSDFLEPFSSVHFAQTKMFTLIQNDENESYILFIAFF
mgnify:CR=1 FL=1